MILIDFVHDFNFFVFIFLCVAVPTSLPSSFVIYFVSKIKEKNTLRENENRKKMSKSTRKVFSHPSTELQNLLCLSFFVNSTQIVPYTNICSFMFSFFYSHFIYKFFLLLYTHKPIFALLLLPFFMLWKFLLVDISPFSSFSFFFYLLYSHVSIKTEISRK